MKKLVFFGDSITDMNHSRDTNNVFSYGTGFVFLIASKLSKKLNNYQLVNKGIGGNTILDLWERYEEDVIKENPDVVTILIGVNDVWHRIFNSSSRGSKLNKFIRYYEDMIIEFKNKLPNTKIIILEPFFTHGEATDYLDKYHEFEEVYKYAKKIKSLAKKYDIPFVPLQKKIAKGQMEYSTNCLYDGVHPSVIGASIIADEWMKTFKKLGL